MSTAENAEVSVDNPQPTKIHPVLSTYSTRIQGLRAQRAIAQITRENALFGMVGCIVLTAALTGLALTHQHFSLLWSTLSIVGLLYSSQRYFRSGKQWREVERRCGYFERGIRRLTGVWQGEGRSGEEFARDHHLYQSDLNVIGNGSLFELLCTTRSELGAERLAAYLLDPVSMDESRVRQEAVKELRDLSYLREEMNLLGDFRSQDCGYSTFAEWLSLPPIASSTSVRYLLLLSSSTSVILGVGVFGHALLWSQWLPFLLMLIIVQSAVAGVYFRRIRPRLRQLRLLTNAFTILQQGLNLMEKQEFRSSKLQELVARVRQQNASGHLKTLEELVRLFDQREKTQFQLLSYLVAVGTQLVLAVENWRYQHQLNFSGWIDAWSEFEALQAMAGYAFEQPDCVFPELVDEGSIFEGVRLGHPLLNSKSCVCNNIMLNGQSRVYLITGSNMAGKSTLLRTIGLNAVIALGGGPVRASSARLSGLTVCASLAITDSLLEGKSKFLAEVARLSESIALGRSGKSVLFLIDEILSGTNSQDRREAVETVVKILIEAGAVGAISTHDLALTQIVSDPALACNLVHMESNNPDDPLAFDYLLKPGVPNSSNALAIVRMMGIRELRVSVT